MRLTGGRQLGLVATCETGNFARMSPTGIAEYSARALRGVWKAGRFSCWLTTLMHRFADGGEFDRRIQEAELDYLAGSEAAQRSFAENYTGLPL